MYPDPHSWGDGDEFPDYLDEIDDLLDQGADVDAQDYYGLTPLFIASSYGHAPIVKKLLERGADFRIKTPAGRTPLSVAILRDYPLVVQALTDAGATE